MIYTSMVRGSGGCLNAAVQARTRSGRRQCNSSCSLLVVVVLEM